MNNSPPPPPAPGSLISNLGAHFAQRWAESRKPALFLWTIITMIQTQQRSGYFQSDSAHLTPSLLPYTGIESHLMGERLSRRYSVLEVGRILQSMSHTAYAIWFFRYGCSAHMDPNWKVCSRSGSPESGSAHPCPVLRCTRTRWLD